MNSLPGKGLCARMSWIDWRQLSDSGCNTNRDGELSMARLTVKQIQDLARSIIGSSPGGIRYSVLVNKIHAGNPETPKNTIHGSVWNLATRFPSEITKPSRGLFLSAAAPTTTTIPPEVSPSTSAEEDFYIPFADWLKNDLDEATVAIT